MRSFYPSTQTKEPYLHTFTRMKKIRDNFLYTTEHGGWACLEDHERVRFLKGQINQEEKNFLENKGIILTQRNLNEILKHSKGRYQFMDYGVALHILIPTLRCNHRCIYCHSGSGDDQSCSQDMNIETADKILDFIFQTPTNIIKIEFQGGEPLLNFDLFKHVVIKAKEKNRTAKKDLSFALVSNLTLMTEERLKWIAEHNVKLSTSLDGPKQVHDANRQYVKGQDTYDDVIKKIKFVKDNGGRVGSLMVTTKNTLPYWKETIDEYAKQKANNIQLKNLNKLGHATDDWEKVGYTKEEFIIFWKKSMDYLLELNKRGVRMTETITRLYLTKLSTRGDPGFTDLRSPCGIASGQLAYNYNGDIYSCDEGRNFELFKLGNVKEDTYKEVIGSDSAQDLLESSIIDNYYCDSCVYKPYCSTCPVINYAENGSIVPNIKKGHRCDITTAQLDWIFEKLVFDQESAKILMGWSR